LHVESCNTAHCKKSINNVRIKTQNNLPSELKRIGNCKVFKNKLKSYLLQNCFYSLQKFLVTMVDDSLVIRVSFNIIRKYIDGLWSVIFTKCMVLCFTWLTCVNIFIALYGIAGSCHPWLVSYSKEILIRMGLYCTLSCILFCIFLKSCWHVVFFCFQLTCPIVPV
jgi:hypothetical protein